MYFSGIIRGLRTIAQPLYPAPSSFWRQDFETACSRLALTFTVEWLRAAFFCVCVCPCIPSQKHSRQGEWVWRWHLSLRLPGSHCFSHCSGGWLRTHHGCISVSNYQHSLCVTFISSLSWKMPKQDTHTEDSSTFLRNSRFSALSGFWFTSVWKRTFEFACKRF